MNLVELFKESTALKILAAIVAFLLSLTGNAQMTKKSSLTQVFKQNNTILVEETFNRCQFESVGNLILNDLELCNETSCTNNK